MGSDRARRSYDESRHYRRVVAQQGRVVVEADGNEAQEILTEETRKEALDFVGPHGTPDDGYKITTETESWGFHIGKGTMYVGGMRVSLAEDTTYGTQPDWPHPPTVTPSDRELVYLHLREQEVSAVEDPALREVALGGPDTAQRTRLIQRVRRHGVAATTCHDALAEATTDWQDDEGRFFDPKTMRLLSGARLMVKFADPPPDADACSPQATSGYLGADNQLLRVMVASPSGGDPPDKLLWAFDNASSLYRIESVAEVDAPAHIMALYLAQTPPDAHRAPRENQIAEILLLAVELDPGQGIAEATGTLRYRLSASYDPVNRRVLIEVPGDPADFYAAAGSSMAYVRFWEDELTLVNETWHALGSTGVQVRPKKADGKPFSGGDYWLIGVRPGTPEMVYPKRLLDEHQPPDGPREWVCPLALLQWGIGSAWVLHDCRQHFDDLVKLTRKPPGCCTVSVGPEELVGETTLQSIVDAYIALARAGARVSICLRAGVYKLKEPIVIKPGLGFAEGEGSLTLDGCDLKAILEVEESAEDAFLHGMIQVIGLPRVTLRGLHLILPRVDFDAAGGTLGGHTTETLYTAAGALIDFRGATVAVGIRLLGGEDVRIHGCRFEGKFPEPDGDPPEVPPAERVFGACIFAQGAQKGLDVRGNTFRNAAVYYEEKWQVFGFLHVPSTTFGLDGNEAIRGTVANASLDDSALCDNVFEQLGTAAFIAGEMGTMRFDGNRVRQCMAGLWFVSLHALSKESGSFEEELDDYTSLYADLISIRASTITKVGSAFGRAYPLPEGVNLGAEAVPPTAVLTSLHDVLAIMEEEFVQEHSSPMPIALSVRNNDIDLATGVSATATAAALAVWETQSGVRNSELIVGNNRMRGKCSFALAMSVLVKRCTVTGNLILNEATAGDPPPYSLVVIGRATLAPPPPPYSSVAITGNVFLRQVNLPVREIMGVPAWVLLNHVEV